MGDRTIIRITQGSIRVRDTRAMLAMGMLKLSAALQACGVAGVIALATRQQAFNTWLIAAVGLFALGTVASLCSLASASLFFGNANSNLVRAWKEHCEGRIGFDELFPTVGALYPGRFDPGPVFGWLAGLFFLAASTTVAIGSAVLAGSTFRLL